VLLACLKRLLLRMVSALELPANLLTQPTNQPINHPLTEKKK
jgi:hypothetical protein